MLGSEAATRRLCILYQFLLLPHSYQQHTNAENVDPFGPDCARHDPIQAKVE
jgi:hypothetical protein